MKPTFLAVPLLLLFSFAPAKPYQKIQESTVTVSFNLDGDPEKQRRCTGFQVAINAALTAEHCLPPNGEDVYVDGKLSRVIRKDEAFGLVETAPASKPLAVLGDLPARSTEVWSWGHAYGSEIVAVRRTVAAIIDGHMILDGPIAPGMSGGPIVDADSRVVGLNQAANDVLGIACTVKEIKDFLK